MARPRRRQRRIARPLSAQGRSLTVDMPEDQAPPVDTAMDEPRPSTPGEDHPEPPPFTLEGKRVIVQGLGNVGYHAAKFLQEEDGAIITGIIEHDGALFSPDGLDVEAVRAWLMHHGGSSSASTVRRRPQRSPERLQTHLWAPAITPIDCGSRWRRQRG